MSNDTTAGTLAGSPIKRLVESNLFKRFIVGLIVINAILLGVETMRQLPANVLDMAFGINRMILIVFVAEILLRIGAHRFAFFRDPWSLFDFAIVLVSVLAPSGPMQVLRVLRVLRAMRLVSAVPSLRRVVDGLIAAVPGIGSVGILLLLVLYVASVMATLLFRDVAPQHFADLGMSLFSLFQTMTLDGWPEIAGAVMEELPWAWVFFVTYILIATFMVLNLVIGIVVGAIQTRIEDESDEAQLKTDEMIIQELRALRQDMMDLRSHLGADKR